MTMAWNIDKLRATGDPADATLANMLQLRLEARGDFDLPTADAQQEATEPPVEPALPRSYAMPMARAAIANTAESHIFEPPKDIVHEIQQTSELNMQMQIICGPVLQAIQDKLAILPIQPDKKHLFSRKPKTGEPLCEAWTYENNNWKYQFWLKYESIDKKNQPKSFKMKIVMSDENVYDLRDHYTVGIDFADGAISKIYFINAMHKMHNEDMFRKQLAKHSPVPLQPTDWDIDTFGGSNIVPEENTRIVHIINLEDNNISYVSQYELHFSIRIGETYEKVRQSIKRIYDSETNTFKTTLKCPDQLPQGGRDMDPSTVLDAVKAFASLVPLKTLY